MIKFALVNQPGPTGKERGKTFEVEPSKFGRWLEKRIRTVTSKDELYLMSFSLFDRLQTKSVQESYALVLDADCAPIGFLDETVKWLHEQSLMWWIYTTYSHRLKGKVNKKTDVAGQWDCFRVILPLARPVTDANEYKRLYKAVLALEVVPPSDCWDVNGAKIAQGWYEPGCPNETRSEALIVQHPDDEYFPVDDMLEAYEPEVKPKGKEARGSVDRMQEVLDAFAQKLDDAGYPLRTVVLDEWNRGPCPVGDRPDDANPALTVTGGEGTLTIKCHHYDDPAEHSAHVGEILEKIGCTWADLYPSQPENLDEHIKSAFDSDRTEPYREDELAAMAPLRGRWLLQTPAGFVLREPGGDYGPAVPREMVAGLVRDVLAPAVSAGVELYERTRKGLEIKPVEKLIHEYGSAAQEIVYSYWAERSTLKKRRFIQRIAVPEVFEPEYDAEIDTWLGLLAGSEEKYAMLCGWLATFLELQHPTAALLLTGEPGTGKDLLVAGLAQFWKGRYLSSMAASQKFNMGLMYSPLVVASEGLFMSRDTLGAEPADVLKTWVTDTVHAVEPKGRERIPIEGALRLILTTNQRNSFRMSRTPTESDRKALDDRIVLLRPNTEARNYLHTLGGEEYLVKWTNEGGFARHVMWLRDNYEWTRGSRLLVSGCGGMSELLTVEGSQSKLVLKAILEAVFGRSKDLRAVQFQEGDLWVNRRAIEERWSSFVHDEKRPTDAEAWESVLEPGAKQIRVDGQKPYYRRVRSDVMLSFAAKEGYLDMLETLQ